MVERDFLKGPSTLGFQEKDIAGCSLFGMMSEERKRFPGNDARDAIALMHDRGNGLGGGFAAYGIYPKHKDFWAFHIMYNHEEAKQTTEEYIDRLFDINKAEEIPTRPGEITEHPILQRYFLELREDVPELSKKSVAEEDFIVRTVMDVNERIDGAYIFSSGKNMGVFKAVGYPEHVADFYKVQNYKGYIWTTHGRFPTNTPGWWGGAHPFGLLDWTIVHNGEISSYGINKRYLEMFGYKCTLMTDTEVVTYLFDLLIRRHKLPVEIAAKVLASPLWKYIDRMPENEKKLYTTLRSVYGAAMLNGPFAVILGHKNGVIGLNDRIKLRPLVVGRKDDMLYLSSEECAIREVCPGPDSIWSPPAGEPVIGRLRDNGD